MITNGLHPPNTLRWLFFDLNSYFASCEQQDRPELRGQPVAIVPSDTDHTCAIAASYEAKAYGVKTGTMIHEAKKMCPGLQCVLARHDVYVAYHEKIFAEVERHIPIEIKCSIDEAACRLMRNEQSPDRAVAVARNIKIGLRENIGIAITCSIGIAQNIFLAKTATDMQKPDGLVVLAPNSYREQIFGLKLSDLCGIGANIERRLNRAGIKTVEQLWNTQPKHVRQIWGSVAGETFWYRLRGYDIADKPTKKRVVGHSRVLDPSHRESDKAYPIIQMLAAKACARMRRYGLFARKLIVSVRTKDRSARPPASWSRETSFSASQDMFTIQAALEKLWHQMQRDTGKAALLRVSVTLHDLFERGETTLDLFETAEQAPRRVKNEDLSRAIDQINRRYGAQTVALGSCPRTEAGYVGTKIAFSRIPEQDEFYE